MVIFVSYDACLRLSEFFLVSVLQVSGFIRGVNGYGVVNGCISPAVRAW